MWRRIRTWLSLLFCRESLQRKDESHALMNSLFHAIPDLLFELDADGVFLNIWAQSDQFLPTKKSEMIGQSIYDGLAPGAEASIRKALNEALDHGSSFGCTVCIPAPNGTCRWFELSTSRMKQEEGQRPHFLLLSRDITDHKKLENELRKREQEFRTLVENSPDTIARYDRQCRCRYVNPALAKKTEGGASALLDRTPSQVPGMPQGIELENHIRRVLETAQESEFEFLWSGKDGEEFTSLIRLTPEYGADNGVISVLAVGRDISELSRYRRKVQQMAFFDDLTSLPNRALFYDRLKQLIADSAYHQNLAGVMMIDLDRFKEVNDSLGHPAGDALLREAAVRLSACVRDYDTVARFGGDEFAILLPEIRSGKDIGTVAAKILAGFKQPFRVAGRDVFVSASIGIAVFPDDARVADDLIKQADSAMYLAKRSGRNEFRFYSRELTILASERLTMASDLRRAVNNREFELHYQPQICTLTDSIIGCEALLRWNHPEKALVSPGSFIGIAEDSGFITDISEWVLLTAFRDAVSWNTRGGHSHKIAINLSARLFQSKNFLDTVRAALSRTRCRPDWIELEITESLLLDDGELALQHLADLHRLGFAIAIDDFGTGYSALSYLARFPVDTLKIDRSFIQNIGMDRSSSELVKAMLSLARTLNIVVVAEGVETTEQLSFLKEYGCQIVQGYLLGRPVARADFESTILHA
ncbi:MAG: EAL domain-containing protein [Leptonema illini]|uniref:EAL domain-containing protein n=1 Tax=Leptonema illini TaxID=183 RepID=A0A833LZ96_9LEPT|nr:MAG: EAL domain-containing protein [Leptonema illini]